jgi:polysaccharide export outer membrane protein
MFFKIYVDDLSTHSKSTSRPRLEKIIKRINLKSSEILSSPYYYLQSNDVVYVEPSTDRVAKERNVMLLPIVLSVTTLLVVIIDRIGR